MATLTTTHGQAITVTALTGWDVTTNTVTFSGSSFTTAIPTTTGIVVNSATKITCGIGYIASFV